MDCYKYSACTFVHTQYSEHFAVLVVSLVKWGLAQSMKVLRSNRLYLIISWPVTLIRGSRRRRCMNKLTLLMRWEVECVMSTNSTAWLTSRASVHHSSWPGAALVWNLFPSNYIGMNVVCSSCESPIKGLEA